MPPLLFILPTVMHLNSVCSQTSALHLIVEVSILQILFVRAPILYNVFIRGDTMESRNSQVMERRSTSNERKKNTRHTLMWYLHRTESAMDARIASAQP